MGWSIYIEEHPMFRAYCREEGCVWVSTFGSMTAAEHARDAHIKRHAEHWEYVQKRRAEDQKGQG